MSPPRSFPSSSDARERILETAEGFFANQGFEGTSLREITETAAVNLAAVNYHFGSKEELFRQVFLRRIQPINVRRLELLDEAEDLAGEHSIPVRAILESFVRPVFEVAPRAPAFLPLMARILNAPPSFLIPVMDQQLGSIVARFRKELTAALPQLSPVTLFWRMHFTAGSMLFAAAHHYTIERLSGGMCSTKDWEAILVHLLDFAEAGVRAPARRLPEKATAS